MTPLLGFSSHTGGRLAEIAFLLVFIAGIWMVAAELPWFGSGFAQIRRIVAGVALAAAGALLIVATHWGHFG